jgi:hypothetical protein
LGSRYLIRRHGKKRTMMTHNLPAIAPECSRDPGNFAHLCDMYRQRQDALTLALQIVRMIKAVQRHRGMSMALLGGNPLFRDDFTGLQQQLERRLHALQALAASSTLLTEREQSHLHSAWLTISRNWQQDSVIDNYELHGHLIEQLLVMLATLSRALEKPLMLHGEGREPAAILQDNPSRFRHLEVLHFTLRQMPAAAVTKAPCVSVQNQYLAPPFSVTA